MTEFQKKRLEYFIKAAKKCEYVQLAPGDLEILEIQKDLYERVCNIYWKGWKDAEYKLQNQLEAVMEGERKIEDDIPLIVRQFYNSGSDKGFEEGIEYVISGQMAHDEQKEDALKGL